MRGVAVIDRSDRQAGALGRGDAGERVLEGDAVGGGQAEQRQRAQVNVGAGLEPRRVLSGEGEGKAFVDGRFAAHLFVLRAVDFQIAPFGGRDDGRRIAGVAQPADEHVRERLIIDALAQENADKLVPPSVDLLRRQTAAAQRAELRAIGDMRIGLVRKAGHQRVAPLLDVRDFRAAEYIDERVVDLVPYADRVDERAVQVEEDGLPAGEQSHGSAFPSASRRSRSRYSRAACSVRLRPKR